MPLPLVNGNGTSPSSISIPPTLKQPQSTISIKTEQQVPVLPDFETLTKIVAQQQLSSANEQKKALKPEKTMTHISSTQCKLTQDKTGSDERLRAKYKHLKDKYNRLLQRHRERKQNKRKKRQRHKMIKSEREHESIKEEGEGKEEDEVVRVMGIDDIKIPKYCEDKAAKIKLELEQKLFGGIGTKTKTETATDTNTKKKKRHHQKRPRMVNAINDKMYKCSYCDHEFSRHHHLVRHERMHTGEKPFKCNEVGCDKRFHRNDYLSRHKLADHGVNPYSCQECNKTFRTKKLFDKHQRKYHSNYC